MMMMMMHRPNCERLTVIIYYYEWYPIRNTLGTLQRLERDTHYCTLNKLF